MFYILSYCKLLTLHISYVKGLILPSLHRAFTTLELQKKLRGRKYPLNIVDSVIAEIKGR